MIVIIILYVLVMLSLLAFGVAAYVIQAIGLMRMLQKVGHPRPWLAWIPVADLYVTGELADMYDNGKPQTNFKKLLLCDIIIVLALVLAVIFVALLCIPLGIFIYDESLLLAIILCLIFPPYIAMFVFMIKFTINYIIAVWKVFRIFSPSLSLPFLLLIIFVGNALQPFFFLYSSKNAPQSLRIPVADE